MDKKKGMYVKLDEETIQTIKDIAEDEKKSQADVITSAIENYTRKESDQFIVIMEALSNLMDEKVKEVDDKLNKLQVIGNVIDRDNQILLEFMNHYYLVNNFNSLGTTDRVKTDGLKQAEDLINTRIQKLRQKKLDRDKQTQNS